jgi:hypothetical protein
MQTRSGDFELTMDELRAIAGYAVACAEAALVLFQKARPDDPRPAAALHAARAAELARGDDPVVPCSGRRSPGLPFNGCTLRREPARATR